MVDAGRANRRRWYLFLVACLLWYWLGLSEFAWPVLFRSDGLGLTFNSMMDHMLAGRFDVDPATVQKEGFLRDGRVYAYWGIFPALLRLPLLAFRDGLHWDVTRVSCLAAVTAILAVNYRTLRYVRIGWLAEHGWLSRGLFLALTFSGLQICFLEGSLYQEVCLWAGLFGMIFVHWAVRACLDPSETACALPWMALAAGGALLTRVSMAIGLYAAAGLFILLVGWRCWRGVEDAAPADRRKGLVACGIAICVLALFVGITAWVNYQRWGNPLTFANYDLYIMNADFPDRLPRTARYGLFNVERIPLGLVYFFFPVWALSGANGQLLLQGSYMRLTDAIELPPSSFFLTDGLIIMLCAAFFLSAVRRRWRAWSVDRAAAGLLAGGLSLAPLMMLMAISMNFRYRMEFYPLLLFCAFLGAVAIAKGHPAGAERWRRFAMPLVVSSIFFSHLILILYKIGDLGPAWLLVKHGVINYYLSRG